MRRSVSAFLGVAVAMLLSVVLAVPANAEHPADTKFKNDRPQYKYGYDYYRKEFKPSPGQYIDKQFLSKVQQQLNPNIHPSKTGPAYYLNQARTRALNPSNIPLTGKIIEPGKSVVRAPSTYGPVAKFATGLAGTLGWGRILGTAGLGMGGVTQAPSNARDLALARGVPQTCVDDLRSCGSVDMDTMVKINSCGHLTGANSCTSIGAVGYEGETDFSKWFKDDALPFLDDLWAEITGAKNQDDEEAADLNGHYQYDGTYCNKNVEFHPGTGATGKLTATTKINVTRPLTSYEATQWDTDCGSTMISNLGYGARVKTVCLDSNGLTAGPSNTAGFGIDLGVGAAFNNDGTPKVGLCDSNVTPYTLFSIQFINVYSVTQHRSEPNEKQALQYHEWFNPDPTLNTIEDTKITTAWTCKSPNGTAYNYSKSITKVSAAVAPDCPEGTALETHKITADTAGGGKSRVLDEGAANGAEAAKYPNCNTSGCTMQVYLDGTPCTATRTDCHNWPAVQTLTPSRIKCYWGSYVVPTADCNMLSNAYKSESGVVFDPISGTWLAIDTTGTPIAPNPQPWNPTNPAPVAGTKPGTPAAPATGTFPGTGTSPTDGCVKPSWSWNPVDWVKSPAVCAMRDAFEPKTDVAGRMAGIQAKMAETPPLSWISPPVSGPVSGACPDWVITLPGVSKNVVCESSFTSSIQSARPALFGLVATAMVWPFFRSLWYAAIPILRVAPTGGR